jgi:hypothetical protein
VQSIEISICQIVLSERAIRSTGRTDASVPFLMRHFLFPGLPLGPFPGQSLPVRWGGDAAPPGLPFGLAASAVMN